MDITDKQRKPYRWILFWLLVLLGTFRGIYDLVFFPQRLFWGAWLAPRPQVFVDQRYFQKNQIVVTDQQGKVMAFDLRSEEKWPLRKGLLILNNTFIHCLDRPHQINLTACEKMIRYHFCVDRSSLSDSSVKEEILKTGVQRVEVQLQESQEQEFITYLDVTCSN